jgi:hypothetical protein
LFDVVVSVVLVLEVSSSLIDFDDEGDASSDDDDDENVGGLFGDNEETRLIFLGETKAGRCC